MYEQIPSPCSYSGKDFGEQAYREPGADFDQNVAQLLIGQHRFK